MENIGTLDDQEEGGEKEKDKDESEQKREEESIDMFEGEKSKVRREGGGRGRLVRQVATFEPEEIRSPSCCHPPPDLSQVIYSERISVSANSNSSFCERPVLTPCNTLSSRTGFGNQRQRTIESGPAGSTFAGRGSTKSTRSTSSKHLVKQPSAASSSSFAFLHPSTVSSPNGPKVTLVRGISCSLVDIPTYLSSSVELASLTELTELPSLQPLDSEVVNSRCPVSYLQQSKENIRRLRMDIVDRRERKLTPKKTQWTLICIALAFLTTCVTLVGTMLSYTSDYQDRAVARQLASNNISSLPNLLVHQQLS